MSLSFPTAQRLLISMHIAGVIGLQHPFTQPLFLVLVPFNLVVTAALLFKFHGDFRLPFFVFCVFTYGIGFGVEVLGVHTGIIFGEYGYGDVLGLKQWEVPLLIGLNWLVLIYSTGIIAEKMILLSWIRPFFGAALMVLLDFFIEPVAIRYGFWQWQAAEVPIRNYIAWYVTSLVLLTLFRALPFEKENQLAPWVYGVQLVFFCSTTYYGN